MNIKNLIIGIAIFILTISVAVYGVNSFYKSPDYDDFCSEGYMRIDKSLNESEICPAVCVEMWQIEQGECVFNECGSGCGADGLKTFEKLSQCEIALQGEQCWEVYDRENENYSKNLFFIALPLGILVIALGAIVFGLEAVGAGLMAGGVGIIIWGVTSFWRYADDWLKFVLSLIGLIVVIYIAYYFNNKLNKKFNIFKKKSKKR